MPRDLYFLSFLPVTILFELPKVHFTIGKIFNLFFLPLERICYVIDRKLNFWNTKLETTKPFFHSVRILQLCTVLPSGSNAFVSPSLSSRKIACKMHSTWFKIVCKNFRRSIFACIVMRYFLNLQNILTLTISYVYIFWKR